MDSFALHEAVWDDDIVTLQYLLLQGGHELELRDPHGNTPLLLSYRLGRNKAARMLLAAGAYAKVRTDNGTGWESVQIAAISGNPDLIRTAVLGYLKQTDDGFKERLPEVQARLEKLPDFQCTMSWSFDSWIPLLGRMLPSDTYSIFKRGSNLRLDTTLLGMTGLKWERGSVSLILWGSDMPRPGAMFVTDNELKTAADARMAFTHPQDVHIQDWVRKLLTQKSKITDFWSRDVAPVPVMQQGLIGGFLSKAGRLFGMDNSPRGRLTDSRGSEAEPSSTSSGHSTEDDGSGKSPYVHVDDARQVTEDVGVWSNCSVYEMRNLCVRDTTAPPLLPELKLESWWKPEYSRQATQADMDAAALAGTEYAPTAMRGPDGSPVAAHEVASSEAPEQLLKPLKKMLKAIAAGKINENNAASATLEDVEGISFGDEGNDALPGAEREGPVIVKSYSYEEYFGVPRTAATKAQQAAADAALAAKIASAGFGAAPAASPVPDDAAAPSTPALAAPPGPYVHTDGHLHRPYASLCELRPEKLNVEDKSLDAKVYFSKDFPITVDEFLPVAEMMARTSKHAANLRRFFDAKMPAGAGFPVKFTLPMMFGISATVSFDYCDAGRPIPRSIFEIPKDFKMGAYVERGFIRQL